MELLIIIHLPRASLFATTYAADGPIKEGAATTYGCVDECSTEFDVCVVDMTCLSCISASSDNEERIACGTIFTSTTSSLGDETNMKTACCLNEVNDLDCLDNTPFSEYIECFLENLGCSGELTCYYTSSARATATATSFGFDSVAVLVGLTCALVAHSCRCRSGRGRANS